MAFKINSSGFTLVELVVGLGISSLVILGGASAVKSSSKSSLASSNRSDTFEYFDDIARNINNHNTCAESLLNQQVGASIPSIKKNNVTIFAVNQYLTSKAVLTSMTLEQSPNWVPVAKGFGPASLKVSVVDNGKNITKFFPISVQLNAANMVSGCSQKLELANVDRDIYANVCTDVVRGHMSGSRCRWSKPVITIFTYIPAPPPPPPPAPPAPRVTPTPRVTATPRVTTPPPPPPVDFVCTGPVCGLYETFLGRPPELAGFIHWNAILASGTSLAEVSASISGSREARGERASAQEISEYTAEVTRLGLTTGQNVACGGTINCR